jgi:hypothetical protein
LRRLASPALHGAQDSAHDVEFIAIELGAIEQAAQAFHEVSGTILKIDFV